MTVALGHSYRHPRPRRASRSPPPRVLSMAIGRYCLEFESRRGPIWDYFAARVPALYNADGRAGDRRRSLRSDGGDSLLCVIVALLSSMDLRRGFVGRPPVEQGGLWHRRGVRELFGFAFGKPVPGALSIRRIERWLRALTALGILTTNQLRVKTARGYESKTAIRHVSDELFRLAGMREQLARERREAFQRAEAARAARSIERMRVDGQTPSGTAPTVKDGGPAEAGQSARAGPTAVRELIQRIRPSRRRS
ncbi:MAG TPA: hypothetical protein VFA39_18950 [Steroidobacteraceae bacterium]|nr:hypothetical protein [Steroidobacteraceae bacterium]